MKLYTPEHDSHGRYKRQQVIAQETLQPAYTQEPAGCKRTSRLNADASKHKKEASAVSSDVIKKFSSPGLTAVSCPRVIVSWKDLSLTVPSWVFVRYRNSFFLLSVPADKLTMWTYMSRKCLFIWTIVDKWAINPGFKKKISFYFSGPGLFSFSFDWAT